MSITFVGSPNFTVGRQNAKIDRVVIHWEDGTLQSTDTTFQDVKALTSAHYGVEDKVIHQYVDETNTAYHSGDWPMNLRSIGIEHSAQPGRDATDLTYQTSAQLIADICYREHIPIDREHILKHSEVIPTQCPGTVDIDRLIGLANQARKVDVMDKDDAIAFYWNTLHRRYDLKEVTDAEINGLVGRKFSEAAAASRGSTEWLHQNDLVLNGDARLKVISSLQQPDDKLSRAKELATQIQGL